MLAHLHAIIVHFPLFGIFFAMIPLVWGLVKKDRGMQLVGTIILAISLASLPILMKSGESAMEGFYLGALNPGLDKAGLYYAGLHFQAAQSVSKFGLGLLLVIIIQCIVWKRTYPWKQIIAILILALNLILLLGLSYVGYLGGQIRHPEFRTVSGEVTVPTK